MRASEIMTANVITAEPDTSVGEALRLLYDNDIRHLPVVDNGHLAGILSERDLHGFFLAAVDVEALIENAARASETPVSELMSGAPLTVDTEADHGEIIDMLVEHKIGALPVVDDATEELLGIVSYIDILEAVRDSI